MGTAKTPTFEIGPELSCNYPFKGGGYKKWRGFTLLELLVVIAIAAMLVAVVPTAFEKIREASQYRDTLRAALTDLRTARLQATVLGKPIRFVIDAKERRFGLEGAPLFQLPLSLEMSATVGSSTAVSNADVVDVTFFPEGGATGGTIEFLRKSGGGVRLKVDWLFGRVTQEPRAQ